MLILSGITQRFFGFSDHIELSELHANESFTGRASKASRKERHAPARAGGSRCWEKYSMLRLLTRAVNQGKSSPAPSTLFRIYQSFSN
jgi:hypothetical protein